MTRCDIFCRVVDNLGDAGVCWRLARRLARDHELRVRLWIDLPQTLQSFLAPAPADQLLLATGRIELCTWTDPLDFGQVADLVIETFGCDLPEAYVEALADRASPARWYNLEYLSAEDWIEGCHALPSPHPRLPLSRTFFFPGFSPATGGLLREPDLLTRRARHQGALPAHAPPPAPADPLRISLFCYPDAPVTALLDVLDARNPGARCQVFQGGIRALVERWVEAHPAHRLHFEFLPWLSQDDFDAVLWASDFNLVRGEDSFVRAQWAGRPFLWDIYPQADDAHLVKMAAFLRRYRSALPSAPAAAALGALWQAWVRREAQALDGAWLALQPHLAALRLHAEDWCMRLAQQPELADALLIHAGLAPASGGLQQGFQ